MVAGRKEKCVEKVQTFTFIFSFDVTKNNVQFYECMKVEENKSRKYRETIFMSTNSV